MNGGETELSKQASWALLPRLVLVSTVLKRKGYGKRILQTAEISLLPSLQRSKWANQEELICSWLHDAKANGGVSCSRLWQASSLWKVICANYYCFSHWVQ